MSKQVPSPTDTSDIEVLEYNTSSLGRRSKKSTVQDQERGRQESPQRSLLQDSQHTYENVQSVRENASRKQRQDSIPMTPVSQRGGAYTPTDSPFPRGYRSPSAGPSVMLASTGTLSSCASTNTYTMTGTLKRGGKKKEHEVSLELQLTQAELDRLNRSVVLEEEEKAKGGCLCNGRNGPHIVLLSVFFIPLALISALCMCFYVGTMCWYNIYLCLSEDKTVWHKIFLSPLLIISYPLLIVTIPIFLAIFAAFKQVSWRLSRWLKEIKDFEKGFFGWLCRKISMPECSPYEIIILDEGIEKSVGGATTAV